MWLSKFVYLAGLHSFACQPALRQFEQDDRLRLVDLEEDRSMNVDAYEDDPRIVGRAVARIALLPEPRLPVGLVELLELDAVPRQAGNTRRGYPFIRAGLVVREVYVGIVFDIAQLASALGGDEPQVRPVGALLIGHRS